MALDWSTNISFSGLKRRSAKSDSRYPTKTHMNLAAADKKAVELRKAAPVGIILIVLVFLFAKFGVYDFVDRVNQKSHELAQQQQILSGYEAQLSDYEAVLEEYQSYEAKNLMSDSAAIGSLDALRLVDTIVAPMASISSVNCEDGIITLNLTDISLDGTGNLVNKLYEQPEVSSVSVSSAATDNAGANDAMVAMTVTLQGAGGDL